MTAETVASMTALVAGIGLIHRAVEFNQSTDILDAFFDWETTLTRYTWLSEHRDTLGFLTKTGPLRVLTAFQAVAALATPICLYTNAPFTGLLTAFVLAVHFLRRFRLPYGHNGADQMQSIVWAALTAFAWSSGTFGQIVALGFIAAQAILSYLTAGIAKLASPHWQDGSAVQSVLQTRTFGMPDLGIASVSSFSVVACWGTIAFEMLGPLLVFVGPTPALLFLAGGVVFHASIATLMGLTSFFFAFCATFPALYWASTKICKLWAWNLPV